MRRVQGSKSVICSKTELDIICDISWGLYYSCIYELPLFSLTPQPKFRNQIETEYVLIRPNNKKLTQTFFDRINKTWNKMYD